MVPKQASINAFYYVLYLPPSRKTYTLGVGSIRQNFLSHKGTIHFALQNYTKKMTLANKSAIFLYFYSFSAYYAFLWRTPAPYVLS